MPERDVVANTWKLCRDPRPEVRAQGVALALCLSVQERRTIARLLVLRPKARRFWLGEATEALAVAAGVDLSATEPVVYALITRWLEPFGMTLAEWRAEWARRPLWTHSPLIHADWLTRKRIGEDMAEREGVPLARASSARAKRWKASEQTHRASLLAEIDRLIEPAKN